jgi:hypothetical protein
VLQAILELSYVLDSQTRFKNTSSMSLVVFKQTEISEACIANLSSYSMFEARSEPSPVEKFVLLKLYIGEIVLIQGRLFDERILEVLSIVLDQEPYQQMIRIVGSLAIKRSITII